MSKTIHTAEIAYPYISAPAESVSRPTLRSALSDAGTIIDKATVTNLERISLWKAARVFKHLCVAQDNLNRAIALLCEE